MPVEVWYAEGEAPRVNFTPAHRTSHATVDARRGFIPLTPRRIGIYDGFGFRFPSALWRAGSEPSE